ncbi:MAG: hypothetical protein JWM89_1960 [Acidimicrobiales bacterium]|nr:hypothetical protein [Acidimicrobiales bacterium]
MTATETVTEPETDAPVPAAVRSRPWDAGVRGENLFTLGCWAVVTVPLVVAAVAAVRPRWFPIQDLAQYELRVRDVGGRHTPLIGLAGRIGPWYDPGSHPGPLSFWMLAPVYRLLGSSSAALVASAIFLHASAMGLVLWMAKRRAGVPLVAVTAGALAVLTRFYGPNVFIEPWNPYLPVSWWLVLLFAVWSVVDGDLPMLIPAVVAGSFCAQTHLPYVGLVGGLGAFLLVPLALSFRQARRAEDRGESRRIARWSIGGAVLGVALWTPPVIDQIWGQGNLSRIKDSVSNPTEGVSGFVHGPAELLRNLDPTALLAHHDLTGVSHAGGLNVPAALLLVVWAACAVAAWRFGHRQVLHLHVVVAAALALALFSSTRIYGLLWFYLFLWAWGLAMVMLIASAWTLVLLARSRLAAPARQRLPMAATALGVAVAVVAASAFAVHNRNTEPTRTDLSHELGVVSGQLIHALRSEQVPGDGPEGRYLVRWTDPVTIGSQGWGLVDELERNGLHGGFDSQFGVGGTKHRVLPVRNATAIIEIVVGDTAIAEWDAKADATRVAFVDTRTVAQRRRYAAMVDSVESKLLAAGLTKQAKSWPNSQFTTSLDTAVPEDLHALMRTVLDIPSPVALYLQAPPTT